MNENVESLLLAQLREIRNELGELRSNVASIKTDISDVDRKVDGLTLMLGMLAGHVQHIDERVAKLEGGSE